MTRTAPGGASNGGKTHLRDIICVYSPTQQQRPDTKQNSHGRHGSPKPKSKVSSRNIPCMLILKRGLQELLRCKRLRRWRPSQPRALVIMAKMIISMSNATRSKSGPLKIVFPRGSRARATISTDFNPEIRSPRSTDTKDFFCEIFQGQIPEWVMTLTLDLYILFKHGSRKTSLLYTTVVDALLTPVHLSSINAQSCNADVPHHQTQCPRSSNYLGSNGLLFVFTSLGF